MTSGPYYQEIAGELVACRTALKAGVPLLLKGPTGCGKTRLVERLAFEADRPLIVVACNEDTTATDLLGRYLLRGGETIWMDGPATRAARAGAILYLDEVAEAREDVIVVLHSLADHRQTLYLDRRLEEVAATRGFQLVASFNPGYQARTRELKPSTRQRFVTVACTFPRLELEAEIVAKESGLDHARALRLSHLAQTIRKAQDLPVKETVSTRSLVLAARLAVAGLTLRDAATVAMVEPLTDDAEVTTALRNLVALKL